MEAQLEGDERSGPGAWDPITTSPTHAPREPRVRHPSRCSVSHITLQPVRHTLLFASYHRPTLTPANITLHSPLTMARSILALAALVSVAMGQMTINSPASLVQVS